MNIKGLKDLWKQAFGDTDEFLEDFFCVAFSEERCATTEEDGKIAAMLYWFDCAWEGKKVAYIYAVATDEAYRNRGLCRALMESTHQKLQSLGYAGAVLVPGSLSLFSLYKKLGYTPFCSALTVTLDADEEGADLAALSHDEYSRRRMPRLPKDSVVQDDLTFDFLATFCDFYVANDCLFCGSMEEDIFYFQEFLGDPRHVPGILNALGAKKGTLRMEGDTPFAMYRPLGNTLEMPGHFDIPLN